MDKFDILSMDMGEIGGLFSEWGEPKYRVKQLFSWLHEKRAESFDEMSDLSRALRDKLNANCYIPRFETIKTLRSSDGTVKFLFSLEDGNMIETVAMRYERGITVCVSTQVGCRMGCKFCASTKRGLVRGLTAGEILSEVYAAERELKERVHGVVMMGIGEPLDNFGASMRFVDLVTNEEFGLRNRAITLSTCGIVPMMDELSRLKKQLTLSVSLHAADDKKRSETMPINREYPLSELIPACKRYFKATGRRITFEYAVIHGQNDTEEDAEKLADIAKSIGAHINLIPINPIAEADYRATRKDTSDFAGRLVSLGANATVRRTLGADIAAACGQLRREETEKREDGDRK